MKIVQSEQGFQDTYWCNNAGHVKQSKAYTWRIESSLKNPQSPLSGNPKVHLMNLWLLGRTSRFSKRFFGEHLGVPLVWQTAEPLKVLSGVLRYLPWGTHEDSWGSSKNFKILKRTFGFISEPLGSPTKQMRVFWRTFTFLVQNGGKDTEGRKEENMDDENWEDSKSKDTNNRIKWCWSQKNWRFHLSFFIFLNCKTLRVNPINKSPTAALLKKSLTEVRNYFELKWHRYRSISSWVNIGFFLFGSDWTFMFKFQTTWNISLSSTVVLASN